MDVFALAASITLDTTEYEKNLKSAASESKTVKSAMESLITPVDKIQSAFSAIAHPVESAKSALDKVTTAAQSFLHPVETMKGKINEASTALETKRNKLSSLSAAYDSLKAKVASLTEEFNKSVKESGASSEKTQELAKQLRDAEAASEQAKGDMEAYAESIKKAGKETDGTAQKTSSFAEKLKSGLATAAKAGAAAIGAATAAVGAFAKIGVDYNSQMEQYTTNFTTMLGDTEAAVQKVEELKKFAASTPLSMADLATGTQTLLAFGVASEDSTDILRQLGDIALGDADKMQRLSTAFGKANAQGKLTGETVQQMIDAGYNPLIGIAAATGESMEDLQKRMSDGKVTVDELKAALNAATSEGGQFAGGMEAASKTFAGQMSTLKDNAMSLVGEVFQPLSAELTGNILPAAINAVGQITSAFQEGGLSGAMDAFETVLSDGLNMVMSYLPQMVDAGMQLLGSLGEGLIANLPAITDAALQIVTMLATGLIEALPGLATAAVDIITTLADGLSEQLPTLVPVAIDAILQLATTLTDPDNLSNMVDSALELIMSLADGLINALPKLMEKVPVIITNLVTAISNNLPKLLQSGIKLIIKLGEGLIKAIPQLIKNIPQIIRAIVEGFLNLGSEILGIGKNIVSGIWEGIKEKIEWLKNKVKGFFGGILDGAKDFLGIKSPSKLFRDQVGQYIALGVAEGIEDKQDDAVKAAEKLAKNVYSKSKDWAERQTKEQKLSLEEQLEVWEAIQSQFIKESKQYADAEKKVFELREQIQDEYYKKVESIHKDIDALESNYQNTLAERTQEIFNSYKLFDEIPQRQKVSGDDLISNLQEQISTIEEFYSGLNELAARGIGESLIADIRKMGPSAVDELSALLALSDEKLSEYAGLYEEKQALANSVAVGELGELKKETDRKIRENLDALGKLYDTQAPDVGTAFTDGLAKGIQNGMSKVIQSAVSVAQAAVTAVQSTLGGTSASAEFAGMFDSMTSGLGSGLDSQLAEIQKTAAAGISFETADVKSSGPNMGAVLSAVMHGMNSISSMNSGMTIPITLEMDGDVLVQKTYRLYQNEAARVGPAMVRV